jgi:hypothetical protein
VRGISGNLSDKAVHCLGILHYGWDGNLASMVDGTKIEAQAAAVGYVFVSWFSAGADSSRNFW